MKMLAAAISSLLLALSSQALAGSRLFGDPLTFGFTPIQFISPENFRRNILENAKQQATISHFCKGVEIYFNKYSWEKSPCGNIPWKADITSVSGHPLLYTEFGTGKVTTLILGGVHPDELTPIPIAFRLARYLEENPKVYTNKDVRVIIAPLINPDGFFKDKPSRTNANGIDLNRNFYTMDWYDRSKKLWQKGDVNKARYFPGYFPNTEVETLFQIKLVDQYSPDKILSIHAPLGFLDYDGPGDQKPKALSQTEMKAKGLVRTISEKTQNYRIVDYSFYPGSLGNFAGNERMIPTITLELETTDPNLVDRYWGMFLPGFEQSIQYNFKSPLPSTPGNASGFIKNYQAAEDGALQVPRLN